MHAYSVTEDGACLSCVTVPLGDVSCSSDFSWAMSQACYSPLAMSQARPGSFLLSARTLDERMLGNGIDFGSPPTTRGAPFGPVPDPAL